MSTFFAILQPDFYTHFLANIMMLLLASFSLVLFCLCCAFFYYCQALKSGLGTKRWAFAGMLLGPVGWPIFIAKKRLTIRKNSSINFLILNA